MTEPANNTPVTTETLRFRAVKVSSTSLISSLQSDPVVVERVNTRSVIAEESKASFDSLEARKSYPIDVSGKEVQAAALVLGDGQHLSELERRRAASVEVWTL